MAPTVIGLARFLAKGMVETPNLDLDTEVLDCVLVYLTGRRRNFPLVGRSRSLLARSSPATGPGASCRPGREPAA